jgi:hypothetical protein
VARIERNEAAQTYVLYDAHGVIITEMSHVAFLSNPNLKRMNVHGKYRRAGAAAPSRPAQAPGPRNAGPALSRAALRTFALPFTPFPSFAWVEPSKPIEDAGIRAGEIVGYRVWRVIDGRLSSVYQRQYEWRPGHPAEGNVSAGTGIFAFNDRSYLQPYLIMAQMSETMARFEAEAFGMPLNKLTHFVTGTVDLWGEVIEHEMGYRAEYAAVRSLDGGTVKSLDPLRMRYCTTFDMPEAFVRAHRDHLDYGLREFAEQKGGRINFALRERLSAPSEDWPESVRFVTAIFERDPETMNFIVRPSVGSRGVIADWCERNPG